MEARTERWDWAGLGACLAAQGAIVAFLFAGLLRGEVLSAGGILNDQVPFSSAATGEFTEAINGIQGDVWRLMTPMQWRQYTAASQGRFPTWNPHIFCGFPLHADGESAMLNPFHWPYFFVSPNYARGPSTVARLLLSAAAMSLLLRRLGVGPGGAFIGGTAWMLCAFNIRWLLWTATNSTLWMPVLLLALDRFLEQPSRLRFVLAGLAATVLQLAGHPETQFQVGVAAGIYTLGRLGGLSLSWRARWIRLAGCAAVMTVGMLGAAVSVLPFLYQLAGSVEWQERLPHLREVLPGQALTLLVCPDLYGRPVMRNMYLGPVNYNEACGWFGLFPLAVSLAVAAATVVKWSTFERSQRGVLLAGLVVAVGYGTTAFSTGPFAWLADRIPPFDRSDNRRLLLGLQFAGALLAGIGYDRLVHGQDRFLRWSIPIVMGGLGAISAWLVWSTYGTYVFDLFPYLDRTGTWQHGAIRSAAAAVIGLAFVIAVALLSWRPAWMAWRHLVLALVVADLAWAAHGLNPTCDERIADPPAPPALEEVIRLTGSGRLVGTDDILFPNLSLRYGFLDVRGYDFPTPWRMGKLLSRLGIRPGIVLIPASRVFSNGDEDLLAYLDRTGVRFIYSEATAIHRPGTVVPSGWALVSSGTAPDRIYANAGAYPRAWFAEGSVRGTPDAALDHLLDPTGDLRKLSVIETDRADQLASLPHQAEGRVEFLLDAAETVVLRTQSSTGGLVVLADRMDPGWRVTINGQPAVPLLVNYLFRGVVVPAGEHEVRWEYHCPGLPAGVAISLATLAGLVLALWPRRTGRRSVLG